MLETNAFLKFVVAALATWRVTHLVAYEDGPWDLISRVRARAREGFWAKLMDCFYCLSFWVSALVTIALRPDAREWPLIWLGLAGAACLLDRLAKDPVVIQQLNEEEQREQQKGEVEDVLLRSESRESEHDAKYAGSRKLA